MSITIGDVVFDSPVMNAACSVAKTPEDVRALASTGIGIITIGSITLEPRDGNPEPRWFEGDGYALNSYGMPNEGLEKYKILLPDMLTSIHSAGKKVSLSIAGFTTDEYVKLAELAQEVGTDFLELNLGCPNVQIDGKQKSIASFDFGYMKEIILAVANVASMPLIVKLSPYSNPADLQSAAATIIETGKVNAVATSNTFPNGYWAEAGSPVLAMQYGGVSGLALLPIALGQVRQFRSILPNDIAVIGVGGIETKDQVKLYLDAGASAVQVATLIVRDGHKAIEGLL